MLFVTSSYEFLKIYIELDFGKFYLFAFFEVLCEKFRDVAQPGSAHVWGAWGRKFESCHPDKEKNLHICEGFYGIMFIIRM